MRSLHINKFWYRRAGADIYAMDLAAAVAALGHEVHVLSTRHPKNAPHPDDWAWPTYYELSGGGRDLSWRQRIQAVARIFYNQDASQAIRGLLDRYDCRLAHVHNFTKHLSPAVLLALRRHGVPVVATLHDYWLACPTYSLVHANGNRCETECTRFGSHRCIAHRCASGSRSVSAIAAAEFFFQRILGWTSRAIDLLIAPSHFLMNIVAPAIGAGRIEVLPHPRPRYPWSWSPPGEQVRVLYVGRLAREKGVQCLIDAARGARWDLEIVGTGPYEQQLRDLARGFGNVRFRGFLSAEDVRGAMQAAHVIAIPSIWYENAPLVLLEAMAIGRAVLASDIGGISEYAKGAEGVCLVAPGDSAAIRTALDEMAVGAKGLEARGRSCWECSEASPGWPEHLDAVLGLYRSLGAA